MELEWIKILMSQKAENPRCDFGFFENQKCILYNDSDFSGSELHLAWTS